MIDIIKSTADASIYNIPQNIKYRGKLGTGRLDAYEAVKKACSIDLVNKSFSQNTFYDGCIITVKKCIINSETLTLDAKTEVIFEDSFAINNNGILKIPQ